MPILSTFKKGGIHPRDMKSLSSGCKISVLPMPNELVIPMSMHLGAPASLLKNVGDRVFRGEKIGQASGFISADVHSPADGVITAVKKVVLANGVVCDAAVIQTDSEQSNPFSVLRDWNSMSKEQILSEIKDKGIVGTGGATFPANVKLSIPEGKNVDALIINGVECEPYITADHRIMIEKPSEVLEGIMICAKVTSPRQIIIGIEENKPDAAEIIEKKIAELNLHHIRVRLLKMKYPQGDEKQLVKAILDKEIPSGKLPLDVGAVVVNIGTAWSIFKAVAYGQPLIERVVTISGECIKNPCNVIAPMGTKVSDFIEYAGGFKEEPDKMIAGGPMMGFSFFNEETPITKGTNGLLFIKDKKNYEKTACLSCGKCVSACPIGLLPTKMFALITNGKYEEAMKLNLMDCKECGCCAFSCPAHLDLVQAFKTGKKLGRKK
ncbi:MAG: electron transport complex subunit RsxC [Sphaerochaetaceae bacterium]|nr:electron transport complex subunit RsxC [Sphaerochaetaceae bacterium]